MRNLLRSLLLIALATAVTRWGHAESPNTVFGEPLSPEHALTQFRLPAGLKIELVAAEPDVVDPVAAAFDEDGQLWVVEMRDYPNLPAKGHPPQSRISLLEDRDADGRYETSKVFADGLLYCNGVQPWCGGVIATLAGEVAYLRDNDGDGRADHRETWFTGFNAKNSQLMANHPTLALDGYVYVANGLRDGEISPVRESWRSGAKPLSISGMDFRFDPRTGKYDAVTGYSQFGLTFDDFGNRFLCTNRNPCVQVVLENQYIARNKLLALSSVVHDVSPAAEKSRLFPLSRAWTTSNLHAGQFTAACGVTIYRGDGLPRDFYGNSFTCEPTANLVHRDKLELNGVVFDARPNTPEFEFLASADSWFRPVNLTQGPDGALYVIDMYRAVIEHPDSMPDELKNRPENYWGADRGRIYRIVSTEPRSISSRSAKLSSASNQELVSLLDHPNAWHRETAARILLERGKMSEELRAAASRDRSPQARVRALWLLQSLGQLAREDVEAALSDPDRQVRAHAARLAEPWLNTSALLCDRLLALASDENARLRFQAALSLGEISPDKQSERVATALAQIALRDASSPWIRMAVATSLAGRAPATMEILLQLALESQMLARPGMHELIFDLAQPVGANQEAAEIGSVIMWLKPYVQVSTDLASDDKTNANARRDVAIACLNGLGTGANRRGKTLGDFIAQLNDEQRESLNNVFGVAIQVAQDADSESGRRCRALQALRHASYSTAGETLLKLAADKQDPTVRLTAIEALASFDDPSIGPTLLTEFPRQAPAERRAIIDAMLDKTSRAALLLDELEAGRMAISVLQTNQWQRLVAYRDQAVRQRAERLQAATIPADRQKVIETYRAALTLSADPNQGKEIFAKNCAGCHRVAGVGVNVGPDISDTREKPPEQFLVDILDPNRAIDNNYFSYTLILTDGQALAGIIGSETASSLTIRQQDNRTRTVLREDIEELQTGVSLMPAGLEQSISVQQMADLISFLKNWRYLADPPATPPKQTTGKQTQRERRNG